jgi:hypothetical protein
VDNPDLLIGSATAPVCSQGFIATPGGSTRTCTAVQPRLIPVALASGHDDPDHGRPQRQPRLQPAPDVQAFEHQPINLGILGRAASTVPDR